ncbi:MAG: ATP synthase F1 subunit epsilon [Bacteroidia bacterium]|nr:ATP synthase F1 subunit epsilon [Bacteroidia bacterium]
MQLEIISPDKKIFSGEVKSVSLPGVDGSFGVLNRHAPIISSLKKGKVKVLDNQSATHIFEINGGVAEVQNNKLIILAE